MIKDTDNMDPLDTFMSEQLSPPPVGPDGGFNPTLTVQAEPIPEASPENMICLRGPCKYYLQIDSRFNAGNSKGTLMHEPIQNNRFCRAIPGTEIDLTDEIVRDCSEWDPKSKTELVQLKTRRNKWLKENGFKKKEKK